jgi:uncharacterized protein
MTSPTPYLHPKCGKRPRRMDDIVDGLPIWKKVVVGEPLPPHYQSDRSTTPPDSKNHNKYDGVDDNNQHDDCPTRCDRDTVPIRQMLRFGPDENIELQPNANGGGTINISTPKIKTSLAPCIYAPDLKDFLEPGGTSRFLPNPIWFTPSTIWWTNVQDEVTSLKGNADENLEHRNDSNVSQISLEYVNQRIPLNKSSSSSPRLFGADSDPAIIAAIREHATEAALYFITNSTDEILHVQNTKGVTPIIMACQRGNVTIVKELLNRGASPAQVSFNGNTPLLQASHFGHTIIAELLLSSGYDSDNIETSSTSSDTSGRNTIRALLDHANANQTTSLMRASQEGHIDMVRLLLRYYAISSQEPSSSSFMSKRLVAAYVNRRNQENMTALMLASQRGHAAICKILIEYGDDDVLDARTQSDSTSLMLACKRGHYDVVKVLVTAGCELYRQDSRGRTAREVVASRMGRSTNSRNSVTSTSTSNNIDSNKKDMDLMELLDPTIQLDLMQRSASNSRNFDIVKLWNLLQCERAVIPIDDDCTVSIHFVDEVLLGRHSSVRQYGLPYQFRSSRKQALLRTMTLPIPLVRHIVQFMPPPLIWSKRITMLTNRSVINPDATVRCVLDLIDEVLEEGGFIEEFDTAGCIPPPPSPQFVTNWTEWKRWCKDYCHQLQQQQKKNSMSQSDQATTTTPHNTAESENPVPIPQNRLRLIVSRERPNVTLAQMPSFQEDRDKPYTLIEFRRMARYIQVLTHFSPILGPIFSSPPYNVPAGIMQQLITISDVASFVRRMGSSSTTTLSNDNYGIHFDPPIAMDFVMLVSRLCSWYWRERQWTTYSNNSNNNCLQYQENIHSFELATNAFLNTR